MTVLYKNDGSLQCGLDISISLESMEEELKSLGAVITKSEKKVWPGFIAQFCGAPTGQCNVFEITEESWGVGKKAILESGYQLWPSEELLSTLNVMLHGGETFPFTPCDRKTPPSTAVNVTFPSNTGVDISSQRSTTINLSNPNISTGLEQLFGKRLRIYRQGDLITQDYRLDRVNIVLHPSALTIIDIWFG